MTRSSELALLHDPAARHWRRWSKGPISLVLFVAAGLRVLARQGGFPTRCARAHRDPVILVDDNDPAHLEEPKAIRGALIPAWPSLVAW